MVPMGRQSSGHHSKGGAGGPPSGTFPASPAGGCQGAEAKVRRRRDLRNAAAEGWLSIRGWVEGRGYLAAHRVSLLSAPTSSGQCGKSWSGGRGSHPTSAIN